MLHKNLFIYMFTAILIWSVIVLGSLYWNISQNSIFMDKLIKKEAVANFNKDKAFRFWASSHGGLYVKQDEKTPANPNLSHILERDLTTPSGKKLTLMNPAYAMRQMMDDFPDDYGVKGRIVSDKPLWAPNTPDDWEAKAIESFKKGSKEEFEYSMKNGEKYLRLMRPLMAEKSCLKCHDFQGYKEGDVRGGVGVMVKATPYQQEFQKNRFSLIVSHSIIYIVGFLLIIFAGINLDRYINRLEEEQLKVQEANDILDVKVKERTCDLELANIQLRELDKLKSMFVASMSHELRTPLNSIIGFTGVLLQGMTGELNDKQKEQLRRVKKAGEHLLSLISDVIDISKIEAGRVEAVLDSFLLSEIIADAKDEIEVVAKPKNLDIIVEMRQDIKLHTDKRRLYQCLLNYLSNAVKFTEKSGNIIIRVEELKEKVAISVIDNGIGISKEDQSKLFEAFERLDTHLRVKVGGTGLGLYLTRKITEDLLEGTVWVESEEGMSSTFGLSIPKVIEEKPEEEAKDV